MTLDYNATGTWTSTHQMSLNGKRDGFTMADFEAGGRSTLMKRGRPATILEEVVTAVKRWPEFAAAASLSDEWTGRIQASHRLSFPRG